MKTGMSRGRFAAAVLILTLFVVCCCAGTVRSRTDLSVQEIEGYYREQEKGLVEAVRDFLDGEGFVHSGVMLTRHSLSSVGMTYYIVGREKFVPGRNNIKISYVVDRIYSTN